MSPDDTQTAENPDLVLCAALLAGVSYEVAAQSAGCSRSTVVRRMNDPAFRVRLDAMRRDVFARATDQLAAQTMSAIETLAEITADRESPATVRVRAATALLDSAMKFRAAVEIEARMAAIEQALDLRRTR